MKKTIITIIILNIILAIGVIVYITKDDKVTYENVKEVSSSLAIMVYDESLSDYVKQDTIPKGDYALNETKTHCVSNGTIKNYDNVNGTITYSLSSGDECYVYFDISKGPDDTIIAIENGDNLSDAIVAKGTNNLMSDDGTWGIINENGYRYEGDDPANYICFGSEETSCPTDNLYRIIGSFETQYDADGDGTAESTGYLTKIQKNTMYGGATMVYHSTYSGTTINSHYPNSQIYPTLNTTWYGSLSSTYQNQIANVNWKLGAGPNSYSSLTASDFYTHERGTTVNSGVTETEKVFKVGMMYPSDYGYGVLASNCARTTALNSYSGTANCYGLNWLHDASNHQWTMTARIHSSISYVFNVNTNGNVYFNNTSNSRAVRPAFYLSADVKISGGTGLSSDPYRIAI